MATASPTNPPPQSDSTRATENEVGVAGIVIPPCPAILIDLAAEARRDEPDLRRIEQLIEKDVALSAALLKTANSPFFGLRTKINSVRQAVSVLGFSMLSRTVSGLVLRQVLSAGQREALEAFWERSSKLAAATYYVAKQFPGMNRDEAYTYGLFQHCGIPLLLLRFPEYVGTLRHAAAASDRPLTDFEESAHGTNHATVGYLLARTWYLPDDVAEAIRNHHECAQLGDHPATLTEGTRNLLAIGLLSECAVTTQARQAPTADWIAAGDLALEFLGIGQDELDEIVADIGLLIG